jgi:hypothetical protein
MESAAVDRHINNIIAGASGGRAEGEVRRRFALHAGERAAAGMPPAVGSCCQPARQPNGAGATGGAGRRVRQPASLRQKGPPPPPPAHQVAHKRVASLGGEGVCHHVSVKEDGCGGGGVGQGRRSGEWVGGRCVRAGAIRGVGRGVGGARLHSNRQQASVTHRQKLGEPRQMRRRRAQQAAAQAPAHLGPPGRQRGRRAPAGAAA